MSKYCFDIDGTICSNTDGEYELARPFLDRIEYIKSLITKGHVVYFQTARGSETGIDWTELTHKQLVSWGIINPKVYFNKPTADIYVDDKGMNSEVFNWSISNTE